MDPLAVDRLTRAFATVGTRRRLVALLGLLPLASTMPFPQAEPAEAGGGRHRHKKGHHPGGDKRQRKGKQKGKQKGQHRGQHQQTPSSRTLTPTPSPPPSPPCVPKPQTAC